MPPRLTTKIFRERSIAIHGDKYDYSLSEYIGKERPLKIICLEHGVFEQMPCNHWQGKGCWKCAGVKPLTKDEFVQQANMVHDYKYNYSETNYVKHSQKVVINCEEHGPFEQTANSHLQGHGCHYCGLIIRSETCMRKYGVPSFTQTKCFAEAMRKTCLDKYGVDNPIKVDSFKEQMFRTKRKRGNFNSSKTEDKLYEMLLSVFPKNDIKRQYKSDVYPYLCDFYIVSLDLYIEVNCFWSHGGHEFDELNLDDINRLSVWLEKSKSSPAYKKAVRVWTITDKEKYQCVRDNNLNYIVFWKNDLSDANTWLSEFSSKNV